MCFHARPKSTAALRANRQRITGYKLVNRNRTSLHYSGSGLVFTKGRTVAARTDAARFVTCNKRAVYVRAGIYLYNSLRKARAERITGEMAIRVSFSPKDVLGVSADGTLICVRRVRVDS